MNTVSACFRTAALAVTVVVLGGASVLAQGGLKDYRAAYVTQVRENGPRNATGVALGGINRVSNDRLREALLQAQAALHASPPRYAEAEQAYRVAIAADHRDVSAVFGLGYVYSTQQRNAEALELYKRAIDLDPWMPEAHFNLALVYLRLHNKEEALKQLNVLKKLKPDLANMVKQHK
jgi:tetratricopeptide (TPR) repeat protein